MIEGIFARGAIPVLRSSMAFAQDRQKLLVNNIANIETPGYAAQDLPVADFQKSLAQAVAQRDARQDRFLELRGAGVRSRPTGSWEMDPIPDGGAPVRHDGNNVLPEQQMSRLMENTLWHNGLAQMLAQQYNLVATAIRGRV